jgi:hypothetical protein
MISFVYRLTSAVVAGALHALIENDERQRAWLLADRDLGCRVRGGLHIETPPQLVHNDHERRQVAATETPDRRSRATTRGDLRFDLARERECVATRPRCALVMQCAARLADRVRIPFRDEFVVGGKAAGCDHDGPGLDTCPIRHREHRGRLDQPLDPRPPRHFDAIERPDGRERGDDGGALRSRVREAGLFARRDDIEVETPFSFSHSIVGRLRTGDEPPRAARSTGWR